MVDVGLSRFKEEEIQFMRQTVNELCEITYDRLTVFRKMNKNFPTGIFIENIVKNYVGNIVYQGVSDEDNVDDFKRISRHFLAEISDFFETIIERINNKKRLRGLH